MNDVKQIVKQLLSMMTVLRFSPGVDEGTLTTYCWVLEKANPSVDEMKAVAFYTMSRKKEWQTPADLLEALRHVRADNAVTQIDSRQMLTGRGQAAAIPPTDTLRMETMARHSKILKEEIRKIGDVADAG